ncbi:MAG: GH1 family beta-glucosidase [Albidovulum sp.]|nr:GH1 family beta-glucosidase [Albidovulum sp.]
MSESHPGLAEGLAKRANCIQLPAGFLIGTATAAYQIEGAVADDGRGESIWDRFSSQRGRIKGGDTARVACDHYNLFETDIEIMAQLGINAYRFSISWPRIFPDGRGAVNCRGIEFYQRLVDKLLRSGIEPFATLYHWDLPQSLQEQGGGWLRRGVADDFADYAYSVSRKLGDVAHWSTINEPWTFGWWGYGFGTEAPGIDGGAKSALAAIHHALLGHGKAVEAVKSNNSRAEVGIVLDLNCVSPASDVKADFAAAKRFDGCQNRWFLEAIFNSRYPSDMLELFASDGPPVREGDMARISAPLDFLGINCYRRSIIGEGSDFPPLNIRRASPEGRVTAMGWEIWPQSISDILRRVDREYRPNALYITENGAAFEDRFESDGRIIDLDRAEYIIEHLEQSLEAQSRGVNLKGYFAWTLLDNFEWTLGYSARFGLVRVDFGNDCARMLKSSGEYFRQIAMQARSH